MDQRALLQLYAAVSVPACDLDIRVLDLGLFSRSKLSIDIYPIKSNEYNQSKDPSQIIETLRGGFKRQMFYLRDEKNLSPYLATASQFSKYNDLSGRLEQLTDKEAMVYFAYETNNDINMDYKELLNILNKFATLDEFRKVELNWLAIKTADQYQDDSIVFGLPVVARSIDVFRIPKYVFPYATHDGKGNYTLDTCFSDVLVYLKDRQDIVYVDELSVPLSNALAYITNNETKLMGFVVYGNVSSICDMYQSMQKDFTMEGGQQGTIVCTHIIEN